VVQGVDIEIVTGEVVGLVGESGSGKTMTALSVLGLVPAPGVVSGDIGFDGRRLMTLTEAELTNIRGREIGMVFQEPVASLDPVFTIGHQIAEPLRRHLGMSRAEARVRAVELLNRVGVPHPQRRIDDYPHQFSGGMAQRVMLATALSCSPKLLIADEPTTALDVTTQAEILDLLRELQADFGMAVLLITHDLGVIADICDRAYVMYAGQVVEEGGLESVFGRPRHPYTEALLRAAPETSAGARRAAINVIPGSIPEPGEWPTGCRFHPRCRYAIAECEAVEPEYRRVESSMARCLLAEQLTLAASDRNAG
jgi:oligopeptide/dipeptide ABC transporter ATP-binding protein